MFQSSLLKLNAHLKQNFEYPSQKQQILQSIKDNVVKNPQLMLDVLVKYSQVDKIPRQYIEDILNADIQLKPNEMLLMGQFIHLNIKSTLSQFQVEDIEPLLFLMRKLYALYKQSNSSQMGALFLQLTQPTESNEQLLPYYHAILQVTCKLSSKYSDDLPLFCIMYLAKHKVFNYSSLLPMTINLKRIPNNIISTHLLNHTISLQPQFPYHFEVYYKLLLQQLNEHSIHVFASLDVKYWIEWYINYDCNPLMQINLFEKILLFINKTITNGPDYESSLLDVQEPFYPFGNVIPFTPPQLRTYSLKQLTIILAKWQHWMEQPLPVEQQETEHVQNAINQKQFKSTLEQGLKKFNQKPKTGIKFLLENKCCINTPPSIANMLFENGHLLDLHQLGDYLGELENTEIMKSYVDLYDFNELTFITALRVLLNKFRLPGEAQKIDRLMLKFAERYTHSNPNIFANADTAYVLAYSIILLNTDLHNPQVKKRMTLDDFVKNNRGIDDGNDINRELQSAIYTEIKENEIKLDMKRTTVVLQGQQPAQKQQELIIEDMQMIEGEFKKLEKLLGNQNKHPNTPQQSPHISQATSPQSHSSTSPNKEQSSPASPPPATLAVSPSKSQLNQSESQQITPVVTSLINFPYVFASHPDHIRDMFQLGWTSLLATFSHPLLYSQNPFILQLALSGFQCCCAIACKYNLKLELNAFITTLCKYNNTDIIQCLLDICINNGNHLLGNWVGVLDVLGNIKDDKLLVSCDKLFESTASLSGESILEIVSVLCYKSKLELRNHIMYSTTKLVEIAMVNMNRIKIEWTQLWAILGNHFYEISLNNDLEISKFAIDALRQIALIFLQLEELVNFKFQREFLKPFSLILKDSTLQEIKSLIFACILQLIKVKHANLKSGWGMICTIINNPPHQQGYDLLVLLVNEHMDELMANNAISDLLVSIEYYANVPQLPKISLSVVGLLGTLLVKHPEQSHPMLSSLINIIINGELEVRQRALTLLFDHLMAQGPPNSDILDFIQLLFDPLNNTDTDAIIWQSTTMIHVLRLYVQLMTKYYTPGELSRFVGILNKCILHGNYQLI